MRWYQVRMMLLIGMKTSLITYPTTPITANPKAQAYAIFKNSNKNIINIIDLILPF